MITALIDPSGIYGSMLHYGLVIALVGSAILLFLFFWFNGRLDMDESAKYHVFDDEQMEEKIDGQK